MDAICYRVDLKGFRVHVCIKVPCAPLRCDCDSKKAPVDVIWYVVDIKAFCVHPSYASHVIYRPLSDWDVIKSGRCNSLYNGFKGTLHPFIREVLFK